MSEIKLNAQRLKERLYGSDEDLNTPSMKKNWKRFIPPMGFWILLILALQTVQIYFLVNPINLLQQLDVVQVINDVSKKVAVPASEIPIVGVIGDNKVLPDINSLKSENQANAQVYANAMNGDYVLGYSSKMIIYRKNTQSVIYEGLSPVALVTNTQNTVASNIVTKAKELKLLSPDSNQTPQLSVVTDVTSLQNIDRNFYANVQKDDLIAVFPESSLILIYRQSNNTIINSGKVQTSISK